MELKNPQVYQSLQSRKVNKLPDYKTKTVTLNKRIKNKNQNPEQKRRRGSKRPSSWVLSRGAGCRLRPCGLESSFFSRTLRDVFENGKSTYGFTFDISATKSFK